MEFVINEPKKIKIKYGEATLEIMEPTIGQQMKLQEMLETCTKDNKSPYPIMIEWAKSLGLPEEIVLGLSQASFQQLVEFISSPKKKN